MEKNKNHIDHKVQKVMDSIDEIQRVKGNPFLYTRLQERMKQQSESSVNTAPSRLPIWQLATVVVLLLANVFVLQQSGYFEAENTSSLEDFATEYALDESEEDLDYISVNE